MQNKVNFKYLSDIYKKNSEIWSKIGTTLKIPR